MTVEEMLREWPKSHSTIGLGKHNWRLDRVHEMLPGIDPEKLIDLFMDAEYHGNQQRMFDECMGHRFSGTPYPIPTTNRFVDAAFTVFPA